MFHRFGLYRVNSLHSFISQTEIHTGPSLGVFETWVRLSYFGAFVNTQVNVRQSLRKNDTFRLFRKVLSATPLHNFCGLVQISDMCCPTTKEMRQALNTAVLGAYEKTVEQERPSVRGAIKEAAKEAAARPAPDTHRTADKGER